MVLIAHEDKPWEWKDNPCFLKHQGQSECDGVMELKDVTLKNASSYPYTETGPYLEKIWVCNKCGFVYTE